jgi:hypothetical protein
VSVRANQLRRHRCRHRRAESRHERTFRAKIAPSALRLAVARSSQAVAYAYEVGAFSELPKATRALIDTPGLALILMRVPLITTMTLFLGASAVAA